MTSTLRLGLVLILLPVTAYYVLLHARVLRVDHAITQDEPGFIEITAAANPYTAAGVVTCGSVYGPGYAWWARPFAAVIANPYIAHRWASSVALFITLGILGWTLWRNDVGGVETAAGLAIVYILNVSSHSLAACADLPGAMLYLGALAVSRRGTWPALLAGLGLAVLATLTKPYFALGWGIVASHQVLFAPPRRSLAFLGVSAALALGVAGVLHAVAPYYFLSTFLVQTTASVHNLQVLLGQTGEFVLLAGGVIVLAALQRPGKRAVAFSLASPPLSPAVDLWTWSALVATAALLGSLGWHAGNYLVYFYHLLLGPLVIVALGQLRAWPRFGRALLCANLLMLGYLLPPQPSNDNWATLAADVATVTGPVLADPLLEPLARTRPGIELFSHGQTASILQLMDKLGPAVPAAYADIRQELLRRAEETAARIRRREFAAIYICYQDLDTHSIWCYDQRHVLDALRAQYRVVTETPVYPYATPYWDRMRHGQYVYHVTRWEPRTPPRDAVAAVGIRR